MRLVIFTIILMALYFLVIANILMDRIEKGDD